MKAYIVEAGYYEERGVVGIALTYESAERLAESIHPQEDHFFGMDPTCDHWKARDPYPEGIVDPMHRGDYWDCAGCTVSINETEVAE